VRFDRIHLEAYGPFSGLTLDLSAPGVHLVIGPNEAGKSSALAAIEDALFGIPVQTKAGFVHPMPSLVIGLDLRRSDGTDLSVRRLKKRTGDIRRPDDTLISDAELAAFLGHTDRALFRTMYGIGHEQLVAGGEELLAGRGEVGQAIFGAVSGATHLHVQMKQLETRAEALFKPSAAQPRLNAAMRRHDAARKQVRELALPPARYRDLVNEIENLQETVREKRERYAELTRERSMCLLLKAVLPNLRQRGQRALEVTELGPLTRRLRKDLGQNLASVDAERERCREEITRFENEIAKLDRQISAIAVDEAVLGRRTDIEALREERGRFVNAREDRPGVARTAENEERIASDLIARLRPGLSLDEARRQLLFETTTVACIRDLADRHVETRLRLDNSTTSLTKVRGELTDLRRQLDGVADQPDHSLLQAALQAYNAAGNPVSRLESVEVQSRAVESAAAELLGQLGLGGLTLSAIDTLAVPTPSVIESFRSRLDSVAAEIRGLKAAIADATQQRDDDEAALEELVARTEALSDGDLTKSRRNRDHEWARVRSLLLPDQHGDGATPVGGASVGPSVVADEYEAAVADADDIADRLRREADAVARGAALRANLERLNERIGRETEALERCTAERQELLHKWTEQWRPAGIEPAEPAGMGPWLADYAKLKEHAGEAGRLLREREALDSAIEGHRRDLLAGLRSVGAEVDADVAVPTLAVHASSALAGLEQIREQRVSIRQEIDRLTGAEGQLETDRERADEQHREWLAEWTTAVARVGLPPDTTPAAGMAFLADAERLARHLQDASNTRRRVDEIDDYLTGYTQQLQLMVGDVAADLSARDPLSALDAIVERLVAAVEADGAVRTHREHREQREQDLQTAVQALDSAEARVAQLVSEADVADEAELREAVARFGRLLHAEQELERLDDEIKQQSDGRAPSELEAALGGRDEAALGVTSDELKGEIDVLEAELADANTRVGALLAERDKVDGTSLAAGAALEAQLALSEIEELTREYLGLRLAATLLQDQITAYRDQHQAPILRRAAPWLARLTCGHFASLDTDFDEKGQTLLEGVRPNGERVGVAGMSEGTRDQLYLALRLAALVEAAAAQEPFPLVLDDVLMTFDDGRTQAALEILGEVSEQFQVLVFTHHQHLRDIARATLGERVTCHELEPRDYGGSEAVDPAGVGD
jgi:uncharacterized protein YhaN